jgi:hypothetical protein
MDEPTIAVHLTENEVRVLYDRVDQDVQCAEREGIDPAFHIALREKLTEAIYRYRSTETRK